MAKVAIKSVRENLVDIVDGKVAAAIQVPAGFSDTGYVQTTFDKGELVFTGTAKCVDVIVDEKEMVQIQAQKSGLDIPCMLDAKSLAALHEKALTMHPEEIKDRVTPSEAIRIANERVAALRARWKATQPYVIAKDIALGNNQATSLKLSMENFALHVEGFRILVEDVYGLTPAEYESLYSANFNKKTTLDGIVRKIAREAPVSMQKECLFTPHRIIFRACWPEYYKSRFTKPTMMEVIDCKGEVRSSLVHAAQVKETIIEDENEELQGARMLKNGDFSTKKEPKKATITGNGGLVDEVVYEAMNQFFTEVIAVPTEQLFQILACPKEAHIQSYGFIAVIKAREVYPSALDFYFLNSPVDFQADYAEMYFQTRRDANLPEVPALSLMEELYYESKSELEDRLNEIRAMEAQRKEAVSEFDDVLSEIRKAAGELESLLTP